MARAREVVAGKARMEGRSLAEWAITQRYPADQLDPGPDDVVEALTFGPRALAAIEARLAQGGG